MVDISTELEKFGLTEESYEKLLEECQKKVNKETDKDWSEISEEFNLNFNGDTLRKASQTILGGAFVKEYLETKSAKGCAVDEDEMLQRLEDKKRELEREKIRFRDQRNAYNKQNYSAARIDETLSILEDRMKNMARTVFPSNDLVVRDDLYTYDSLPSKGMIVMLSDWHIGMSFDNEFGYYDTDVATERIDTLFKRVIQAADRHGVENVLVVGIGDMISGSIHRTIQVSNKENVIDQVKIATELISSFCYELCRRFKSVKFANVSGNHSRMTDKDKAVHDERLDDLAGWGVKLSLSHLSAFEYIGNIDSGICSVDFMNKKYVAIHGDYDSITKTGVGNLCMMLKEIPYAILCGHNHTSALSDINGVKVVQGGSLCGSGDQYTIEKRLSGKASQTFLICDHEGIECIYNVDFD